MEQKDELQIVMKASDIVKKNDFMSSFKKVLELVLEIKTQTNKAISSLERTYAVLLERTKSDHSSSISDIKNEVKKQLDNLLSKIEKKSGDIDKKLGALRDGKDADEEKMVQNVLTQIKLPEYKETVLDDAFEIRNKLETLNGDERPIWIKELEDKIKGLENKIINIPKGSVGGGKKITYQKQIDLSPQVDGTNKSFTLPVHAIGVSAVICSQFPFIFRKGVDYNLTGNKIILTDQVTAPQLTQTLIVIAETQFFSK